MNDRAWDQLLDLIDEKYEIDQHHKEERPIDGSAHFKQQVHTISFEKDNHKFRIERVVSPAIKDTKTHYSHRGTASRVQAVYDPEETVSKVYFYRQQDSGQWQEVNPENFLTD